MPFIQVSTPNIIFQLLRTIARAYRELYVEIINDYIRRLLQVQCVQQCEHHCEYIVPGPSNQDVTLAKFIEEATK